MDGRARAARRMNPESLRRVTCLIGDITRQEVDAIVNAANPSLRGGGGVDGAIHRAAGAGLLAECIQRPPDGCRPGEARITSGHGLPAPFVIHTPGPVWRGGGAGEGEVLASCFQRSLELAAERELASLAFPAISCGVYGYPPALAAEVAIRALGQGLERAREIEEVRIVLFDEALCAVFHTALQRALSD